MNPTLASPAPDHPRGSRSERLAMLAVAAFGLAPILAVAVGAWYVALKPLL